MRELITSLLFLLCFKGLFAQVNDFPQLPKSGKNSNDFLPLGWRIIAQDSGDLNQDKIKDIAFVLQKTDPKNIVLNDGLGIDTIDKNPRILAIAFKNASKNTYRLVLQSNTFIISYEDPVMDDPFDGINIAKNGTLNISFRIWYSAGSWEMSNHNYQFRFQNNQFKLIGYDATHTNRASGEIRDYSLNFSTKKMHIAKGNIAEDNLKPVKRSSFSLKELKTFKTFITPFTWHFQNLIL